MLKKSFIFSLFALMSTANLAYSGCVQTFGTGAVAKGQSEAVVAQANDPYACYYNPAGLSQIDRPMISASVNLYDAEVKIKDFKITSTKTGGKDLNTFGPPRMHSTGEPLVTPTMGFAMPINDSWSFGVAAYSPYGLRVLWDHTPANNSAALYSWESTYYRTVVSPTAAYKINEKLSAGFGVSLGHSVFHTGRTVPMNPVTGTPGLTAMKLEAEDDFNYSFNAGILYKPQDGLSMGLTYRSQTNTDFEGDIYIAGKKTAPVDIKYDHPQSVQGGIRYNFLEDLAIETDLIWTNWDINSDQTEKTPMSPTGSFHHARNWENTVQYKVGAEWQATESFVVRTGYTYDPTPVPTETFDIGWPDTDRNVFNIGLGWTANDNWSIDSALIYVRSTPMRSVSGSSELNHLYGTLAEKATSGAIPADSVNVSLKDEGLLVGYSMTVNYKF